MCRLILALALLGISQAGASIPPRAIIERCTAERTAEQMRGNLIKDDDLMIMQDWRSGRDFIVPIRCED